MTTILCVSPFYDAKEMKTVLEKSQILLNEKPISAERAIELIGMKRLGLGFSREKITGEFDTEEGKIFIRRRQDE